MPIQNYTTESILVAIGQRYHVIVEANPDPSGGPLPDDGNYWIHIYEADCVHDFTRGDPGYDKVGILSYSGSRTYPNTTAWNVSTECSDEDFNNLVPILPWSVGPPKNGPSGESLAVNFQETPTIFPLASWSLGGDNFNPLRIDYSDPTFLNLNYTGKWDPLKVVYPENYSDTDWVGHNSLEQKN